MGINLVVGPCGSGKTHTCIQQICHLTESNTFSGRVIFMVPEQFSMTVEVMLAESMANRGGFIGAEVLSFSRLAQFCFNELGAASANPLSPVAKIICLSDILNNLKNLDKLSYYLRQSDRSGFASKLLSFISEAKRYGVTPEDLDNFSQEHATSSLGVKYRELAMILEEYNHRIHNLGKDGDEDLYLLAQAIPHCHSLRGSQIWIDSFTDFSPAHMDIILQLALVCSKVTVTIPMEGNNPDNPLFRRGNNTWLAITELCRKHHIPYTLTALNHDMRHLPGSQLAWLQSQYGAITPKIYQGDHNNVDITSCSDSFVECTLVAERILQDVTQGNLRYGQIAVAAGAISDYAGIIQPIFEEYGIPYFFDSLENIFSAPLPLCIVSMLRCITDGGDITDRLFTALRTGLTELDDHSIDVLENYCLEHGIKYNSQWKKFDLEAHPDAPLSISYVQDLLAYLEVCFGKAMTPAQFATDTALFIQKYLLEGYSSLINHMAQDSENPESLRRADQFRQIWAKVLQVLDSLKTCTGSGEYNPKQLINLLNAGLDSTQVGSIPSGNDIVIITDINRMRSRSLPCLYIIGARDGQFPSVPSPDGIIPDSERLTLRSRGITLAPTADEAVFDREYETYYALTISTEQLHISYSCSTPQGTKLEPAYLVSWIAKALGITISDGQTSISGGTAFNRFMVALGNNQPILNRILAYYSRVPYVTPDPIPEDGVYAKLWNLFLKNPIYAKTCSSIIAQHLRQRSLVKMPQDINIMSIMGQVIPVTTLEEYADCPYRCYLDKVLALRQRRDCSLNISDLGSLVHDILYDSGKKLSRHNLWHSITSIEAAQAYVDPILEEYLSSPKYRDLMGNYISFHGRSYIRTTASSALYVCAREFSDSQFNPREFELLFSQNKGIQPIEVQGENGSVYLSGKIDRVDCKSDNGHNIIRVIDYKTGHVTIDNSQIYYGTSLQLPLYLKGYQDYLRSSGIDALPESMGYMSLAKSETDQKVMIPDQSISQDSLYKNLCPALLIHNEETRVDKVKISVNMPEIIGYASHIAGQFGDAISRGLFPVLPLHEDSCKYCEYKNLCGKDLTPCRYRAGSATELEMALIINGYSSEDLNG